MANVVDELLISIGVDSKELMSGINQAQTDIKGFANGAARSFSGISKAGKGAGKSLRSLSRTFPERCRM